MVRTRLSRPLGLVLSHALLTPEATLLDYGCGRGGDVTRLLSMGYSATGWDPTHAPHGELAAADVVNLGYVLNVIEEPSERVEVLRRAWKLALEVLVVAVRPDWEIRGVEGRRFGDGIVTTKSTFQKFFAQEEIRGLIEAVVGKPPVAVAPGVFYVFRDPARTEDFRARLVRNRSSTPRMSLSESRFNQHRDLLDPLIAFIEDRGRLPTDVELTNADRVQAEFGSIKAAARLIQRVAPPSQWEAARQRATDNLVVFLALSAFRGRPRLTDLPEGLQADVKALFGTYKAACSEADRALFSLGHRERLDDELSSCSAGKLLPDAVYLHNSAIARQSRVVRLYEGCGRALVGDVPGANLVKLSRQSRRISYLSYPQFDTDPHPALVESIRVDLQTFGVRQMNFANSPNPPILHRKEAFVDSDYPGRAKFARLTASEERRGLLAEPATIGHRNEWTYLLAQRGLMLTGHRLVGIALAVNVDHDAV